MNPGNCQTKIASKRTSSGTHQFRLSGGGLSLIAEPPAVLGGVGPGGAAVGTFVVGVGIDEVEDVERVVGCAPAAAGVQNPANQVCNVPNSAGEQAGQICAGVAARGFNKLDSQKHD